MAAASQKAEGCERQTEHESGNPATKRLYSRWALWAVGGKKRDSVMILARAREHTVTVTPVCSARPTHERV